MSSFEKMKKIVEFKQIVLEWSSSKNKKSLLLHFIHKLLCFLTAISVPGLHHIIDEEVHNIIKTVDDDAMSNWGYNIYEGYD